MKDATSICEIIRISADSSKPALTIESDWFIIVIIIFAAIIAIIVKRNCLKSFKCQEMKFEISGSPKVIFKVERNDDNLFIANRIHIELTTRKAAIEIDDNNDVIEEVYNSWYELFGIIRDEIKSLPGRYLRKHDPTSALIGLTRRILNDAMRPHLTEYQAKFRRWFEQAKNNPANVNKSPQEIQKLYPDYNNLISSMKMVNKALIDYANELDKLIKG